MASIPSTSREIRLVSRPQGWPTAGNFTIATVPLREPGDGEVVVRNDFMSVEPYMRGRMNEGKSYVPPFVLGEALSGAAVGEVVASAAASLPVGTQVSSDLGWREYAAGPATAFRALPSGFASPSVFLGALGVPGFTAYVGLHDIGSLEKDDTIFISSAAGAVGSMAGQLAKLAGARVIGSAGGEEKVRYLIETLGFDTAFDYKAGDILESLRACAPDGIDLYFDNVGGEQLEAALFCLNDFGRAVECGMISQYNEPTPGPRNLALIIGRRLTVRGFIILDHQARYPDFLRDVAPLVQSGAINFAESFADGIENAPQAFIDMLRGGKYTGKVVVRLGSPAR
jgi:NADPH-dependent curcumin reductase CurA